MSLRIRIVLMVVSLVLVVAGLLAYNYFGTDLDTLPVEKTVIERMYQKTEYRQRRMRKGVYIRDNPHQVYHIEVVRPNGKSKDLTVDYQLYHRARRGDTILMHAGRGRLGWEITNTRDLRLRRR